METQPELLQTSRLLRGAQATKTDYDIEDIVTKTKELLKSTFEGGNRKSGNK